MHAARAAFLASLALSVVGCFKKDDPIDVLTGCSIAVATGFRPLATTRDERFLGKVQSSTAACRGGDRVAAHAATPWVDWSNYWGTGDGSSKSWIWWRNERGINGSL